MRGSGRHNEEERWDEGEKGGGWIEGAGHYGISLIASNRPRIVPSARNCRAGSRLFDRFNYTRGPGITHEEAARKLVFSRIFSRFRAPLGRRELIDFLQISQFDYPRTLD